MIKKTCLTMFIAGAVFSTPMHAVQQIPLTEGISMEYELKPNEAQEFTNIAPWKIQAKCTMHTQDASDPIYIEALKKKGKINDISLSEGDHTTLEIINGQSFSLSAERAAKVRMTNLGAHIVRTKCST